MAVEFALIDAGVCEYRALYDKQKELVSQKRRAAQHDYLIFVEHPDVYTFGRKSKDPIPPYLKNAVEVERGGEVTFHNPGQLVCYPILQLEEGERDVHLHLRRLENTLISVLADFGLTGERREGATGVWIKGKQKKIASIGVAVSGWITYHGSALNVSNDLAGFSLIHPCGFPSEVMTSMGEELRGKSPSLAQVKTSFLAHFSNYFQRRYIH